MSMPRVGLRVAAAFIVMAVVGWALLRMRWRPDRTLLQTVRESGVVPKPVARVHERTAIVVGPVTANPIRTANAATRVEKIRHDYAEMSARFTAEFQAAGADFPGGVNAYLRQLALLEREKWKDIGAILSPRELEELQMQDTHAGKEVQRLLGDTAATHEQKRAVFRLQQKFDDTWALTFDPAPAELLARQTAWQAVQEQILAQLGPGLFGVWLRGNDFDFAQATAWGARHGAGPDFALDEWRLKNEFVRGRLEIAAQHLPADEAQARFAALIQHTRERALALFGPAVVEAAQAEGRDLWAPSGDARAGR
jgi:hypothetical protein